MGVLVPMASLKDMANNPLPMANSPLLVISLLNLFIPSNLHTPNLLTHSSQPTHSHLLTPSHLLMVNSLSTLKVVQLDLLGGSALSPVLKAPRFFVDIVHFK